MDPRKFDDAVKRFASRVTRRNLLRDSTGAAALALMGVSDDLLAQDVGTEACIPTGRKCPSKKPRGKKAKKLGCDQCCQRYSVPGPRGKRKCACKPADVPCGNDAQCCSGVCDGGVCLGFVS